MKDYVITNGKSYYRQNTGIGPAFGAQVDSTPRFSTKAEAQSVIDGFPLIAAMSCKVEGVAALSLSTARWAWPMWLGLAIWRAREKARWEHVVMPVAQRWMTGWEPDHHDIREFLYNGLREELARDDRWAKERLARQLRREDRSRAAKLGWERRKARAA